jgi:hypothetical protein
MTTENPSAFLFTQQHESFLRGTHSRPAALITGVQAFQQFSILFCFVALPITLLISVPVSLAGYSLQLLLPALLLTGIASSCYFAWQRYQHDKRLSTTGNILYGMIMQHEQIAGYLPGSTVTRILYRFQLPDGETRYHHRDLSFPDERLPDGRTLPQPGTPIAILYADQHTLLLL